MRRIAIVFAAFLFATAALAAGTGDNSAALPDVGAASATRAMLAKAKSVTAPHAMVVTPQHLATEIGVDILKHGGNAVDAAVAAGYALAVVHPCCGNIGGGGFMVAHLANGKNLFLDFREKAPHAATPTMFQDANGNVVAGRNTATWLATGVPGTVMGLNEALATYGTIPLAKAMAPAIALAKNGYVLNDADARILGLRAKTFAEEPNAAAIFLNHGRPFKAGERLTQKELAATLEAIAKGGTDAFYKGAIAKKIVAASEKNGGILTMKDFAEYTAPWTKPVTCDYRGYEIVSAPPPSSGGTTVCEILQIVKPYPFRKWGYASVKVTHYLVEAERYAFADRNTYLGDPAFVKNPVARLISAQHAAKICAQIHPNKATPSSDVHGSLGAAEGMHTAHYSIVDRHGNAVGVTYTLNFFFGNGKIAGDTGFFLNDEMDDFTAKPGVPNGYGLVQGKVNQVEPGKRPLSSMTPTIVLKNGKLFMVTGSPGGATIISTVLESILNTVDFGMNMQAAVDAPRVHHQWLPDVVFVEPGYLTPETRGPLEKMGYRFIERSPWGADEAILRNPKTHMLEGANDNRRPSGLAAGY